VGWASVLGNASPLQSGASLICQDFTTVVIKIGRLRSVVTLWYDTTA
jgi:hypothetical protein